MFRQEIEKRKQMNYYKIYEQLIAKRQLYPISQNEFGHNHHIKPKCLFPELKNDKSNIIRLTAREHFIAHLLLAKHYLVTCGQNSNEYRMMISAVWLMRKARGITVNSRMYAYLCHLFSISRQGRKHSDETRRKISIKCKGIPPPNKGKHGIQVAWNKGIKCPQISKTLQERKPWLNYVVSQTTRQNLSKALKGKNKGKIYVTDGKITKFVHPDKIPIGFKRGHAPNSNKGIYNLKGKIYVNNGQINRCVLPNEIPIGFVKGRLPRKSTMKKAIPKVKKAVKKTQKKGKKA